MFGFFSHEAWGILAPQPGIEPAPPALEGKLNLPNLNPNLIKPKPNLTH